MEFFKITASGNDFIVIDNRNGLLSKRKQAAVRLCSRTFGIGADGLLLLEKSGKAAFMMRMFNPDGSEAEMCGNGLRCILRFASENKIARDKLIKVETKAGILEGQVSGAKVKAQLKIDGEPRLNLKIPAGKTSVKASFINTGVPHTVIEIKDIEKAKPCDIGPAIRYHAMFKPGGTNVDWIEVADKQTIKLRTYERGVEGETLSCGTGSVAGAIISYLLGLTSPPVNVIARSGEKLKVYFDSSIENVHLEGNTFIAFKGCWLGK